METPKTFNELASAINAALVEAFTTIELQPNQAEKDILQTAILSAVSRKLTKEQKLILVQFLQEDLKG